MSATVLGWTLAYPHLGFGQDLGQTPEAATTAPPSAATTTKPTTTGVADQAADTGQLEVIIVTAQRREERLQDVPMSVTAMSSVMLSRLSIDTQKDLQFATPGLTFPEDNGTANPYIRGRGTGYSGTGLEGSIALYVDDVYQQSQFGTSGLIDVSQIQVLKGPQGTLYGRNATGGAIVTTTADPTQQFEGYVDAGFGNLNSKTGGGMLNVPVNDTLAFRIAGGWEDRDGFLDNLNDGSENGQYERLQLRAKLLWEPTDNFSAVLKQEYQRIVGGYLRRQIIDGTGTPTGLGEYETVQTPDGGGVRRPQESKVWSSTLRINYESDLWMLTSVTGYRDTKSVGCADGDNQLPYTNTFCFGLPSTPKFPNGLGGVEDETYSQELRWLSRFQGPLNFALGGYYQHSEARSPATLRSDLFGGLEPLFDNYNELDTTSAFAEVYYEMTDRLKLTLGGRYNEDRKDLLVVNNDDVATAFGIPPAFLPAQFTQDVKFDTFTPRVVLAYQTDNLNVYTSYNKGFKAGGFNSPALLPQVPLKPEEIEGYEVGFKSEMLDNRLRVNGSVFYSESTNVQVASIDPINATVVQQNAAEVTAKGAEMDVQFAATPDLFFQLGAAYLDSEFDKFPAASVFLLSGGQIVGGSENLAGFATPNSPEWTFNGSATSDFDLPANWSGQLTFAGRYSTEYDTQSGAGGPLRADRQDSFAVFNLTGDVTTPNGRVTLSWFVENLFDKAYSDQIQTGATIPPVAGVTGGGTYNVPALPRTYGASVRYSF